MEQGNAQEERTAAIRDLHERIRRQREKRVREFEAAKRATPWVGFVPAPRNALTTAGREAKATEGRHFASSASDKSDKDVCSPIKRPAVRRVHFMDDVVGTGLALKRDDNGSDSSSAGHSDKCSSAGDREEIPAEQLHSLHEAKLNALTHKAPAYIYP